MAIKTYAENGKNYQFDNYELKFEIQQRKQTHTVQGEKLTKLKIYNEMSDELSVSVDAVKSWEKGVNGPLDLDMVKRIAGYFNTDYHVFLKEIKEDKDMLETNLRDIADEKQRMATRDRVRDIYEALVEAVDKAHRYFYFELYTYHKSDLVSIYDTEYEEAADACCRVKFLLHKYTLDLPKELESKIRKICMVEAEGFVEDTCTAFIIGEENEEIINELWHKLEFEMVDYYCKLEEVFGEFRVQ